LAEFIEDDYEEEFDNELLAEYFKVYGSDRDGEVLFSLEKLRELTKQRAKRHQQQGQDGNGDEVMVLKLLMLLQLAYYQGCRNYQGRY
jgi:hypothetical protein